MKTFFVASALLVASSAQAQSPTESLTETASRLYVECAKAAVPSLDDGVSDAATIAIGLQAACMDAFSNANWNSERQKDMVQLLKPYLVRITLLYRVAKRRNSKV